MIFFLIYRSATPPGVALYPVRHGGHLRRGVPTNLLKDHHGYGTILLVINMEKPRRKPNRIRDYNYSQNGAYFITVCTQSRRKILSEITVGTPLLGCPQEPCLKLLRHGWIADKVIRQLDSFYDHLSVDKYVIMPDHIHFLITVYGACECPETEQPERTSVISRFVGTFKRFCNRECGENIWQSRYYDHVIRNQQDYNEIWEYIDNNPRKWIMR